MGGGDGVFDYGVAILGEVIAPIVVFLVGGGEGCVRHNGGLGFNEGRRECEERVGESN
jgi:hypothetical protein